MSVPRFHKLMNKLRFIDRKNEQEIIRIGQEYVDVLASLATSEYTQHTARNLPAVKNSNQPPAEDSSRPLPPAKTSRPQSPAKDTCQSPPPTKDTSRPLPPTQNTSQPFPSELQGLLVIKDSIVNIYTQDPTQENKGVMEALLCEIELQAAEFRSLPPALQALLNAKDLAAKIYSQDPSQGHKDIMEALVRETERQLAEFRSRDSDLPSSPAVNTSQPLHRLEDIPLPPLLKKVLWAALEYSKAPAAGNIRLLKNLMRHDAPGSVPFEDRIDELVTKTRSLNMEDKDEVNRVANDYLRELISATSILRKYRIMKPATTEVEKTDELPLDYSTLTLPPALHELRRRKNAARKEYERWPAPENKKILRKLEGRVKRGVAEFKRTGNYCPRYTD